MDVNVKEKKKCSTYFTDESISCNIDLPQVSEKLEAFMEQLDTNSKICLIGSGGTKVPIERRTVRFLDNFSDGNRGAASAECLLDQGYSVVFLHRGNSCLPFHRMFSKTPALDLLALGTDGSVTVSPEMQPSCERALTRYLACRHRILLMPFHTLADYLFLVKEVSLVLAALKERLMVYLPAAVSDFYMPFKEMEEHKIQSSGGDLTLNLKATPKMLFPLVSDWLPKAYVVSFKLETNPDILIKKATEALSKFGHQLVIANLLHNYKDQVQLVTPDEEAPVILKRKGEEIEGDIVEKICELHLKHIMREQL